MKSSRKEESGSRLSQTQGAHGSTKKTRFPIHITTFNMAGPAKKTESERPESKTGLDANYLKPADQRRKVIRTTLGTLRPSLIFCQELPGCFQTEVIDGEHYEFQKNGNQAGVVWRKDYFKKCADSPKTTDRGIQMIRDRLSKSGEEVSELLSRVAMVKLEDKQCGKELLAVSWHGPWSGKAGYTNEKKKKIFGGLVHFCQEVSRQVGNVPFIIGGDFNFATSGLDKSLLSKEGIGCSTYELSERAQEASSATPHKDTFVFSSGILLKDVKSYNFPTVSGRPENAPDPVKLLDHDPISAVLSFEEVGVSDTPGALPDKDVPDLRTGLENLSLGRTAAGGQGSRFSRPHFQGGLGGGTGWERL